MERSNASWPPDPGPQVVPAPGAPTEAGGRIAGSAAHAASGRERRCAGASDLPAKRVPFPFAPRGERSIARGYPKALGRAHSLIYTEDQYVWSREVGRVFAQALARSPKLRMIAVVPRHPDRDGTVSGPLNRIGQQEALSIVRAAGGDRVAVYDLETEAARPIYVHAKLCVIDDVWMAVGSDDLHLRSWTHDSEVCCAIIDSARDPREPLDPGGVGDGARVLPRELRLALWREHLGAGASDQEILDPQAGFEGGDAWRGLWTPGTPGAARGHVRRAARDATSHRPSVASPPGGHAPFTGSAWTPTGVPRISSAPAAFELTSWGVRCVRSSCGSRLGGTGPH